MDRLVIDIVTLFPGMLEGALARSILGRAQGRGLVEVRLHDLRAFGLPPHASVDDAPFGGGGGMVLRPDPLFAAVEAVTGRAAGVAVPGEAVALLTPAGRPFDQAMARRFASLERLVLLCGRYEGVDERVRESLATEAVSLGDFVLSGGEPAALAITDAVVRLLPGALGNPDGAARESHEGGLLEAPQYTRPAVFRGLAVPAVLLSGNHGDVEKHRRRESLRVTARVRPDLIERAARDGRLSPADREFLDALRKSGEIDLPCEVVVS